jgi:hypothetical protein
MVMNCAILPMTLRIAPYFKLFPDHFYLQNLMKVAKVEHKCYRHRKEEWIGWSHEKEVNELEMVNSPLYM